MNAEDISFKLQHARSSLVTAGFSLSASAVASDWMGDPNKRNASGHQADESNQRTRPPSYY